MSLKKTSGDTTFGVSVFHNKINNYIYGRTLDALDGLQLLQYSQADATFTGIEARCARPSRATWGSRCLATPCAPSSTVAAICRASRPPALACGWMPTGQAWEGQVEWVQVARQNRVAAFETATPATAC